MSINFAKTCLAIPNRPDIERDAVAVAWENAGGVVVRVDKFWEFINIHKSNTKVYGDSIFCLVIQEKNPIRLVTPDNYTPITLERRWYRRKITLSILRNAHEFQYPLFCKPFIPKNFRSGIYYCADELEKECYGLEGDAKLFISEIVNFENEVRCFILRNNVETISAYKGKADLKSAKEFVESFLADEKNKRVLVDTYVLDIGFITDCGWAIIETNAVWGAGLNGCDPNKAINCIYHATKPARFYNEMIHISLDDVCEILFNGSLDDMLGLIGLDITYDYHLFSSSKGDSMNVQVGCKTVHIDGPNHLPNCLQYFGYSHDFKEGYP